jgi:hypothetical protein
VSPRRSFEGTHNGSHQRGHNDQRQQRPGDYNNRAGASQDNGQRRNGNYSVNSDRRSPGRDRRSGYNIDAHNSQANRDNWD